MSEGRYPGVGREQIHRSSFSSIQTLNRLDDTHLRGEDALSYSVY